MLKGDFAVYLSSKMKFKKALLCNAIGCVFIYFGAFIGLLIGDFGEAKHWIYAFASGVFIYICVCDLVS
jgi:solute carrier family 39 (zinc transporter), member 4